MSIGMEPQSWERAKAAGDTQIPVVSTISGSQPSGQKTLCLDLVSNFKVEEPPWRVLTAGLLSRCLGRRADECACCRVCIGRPFFSAN
jgi:hypothetical protein